MVQLSLLPDGTVHRRITGLRVSKVTPYHMTSYPLTTCMEGTIQLHMMVSWYTPTMNEALVILCLVGFIYLWPFF